MEQLRTYILTVIATAVVCALIQLLFESDKGLSALIKLVTGLVMIVTVVSPLMKIDMSDLEGYLTEISIDKETIVNEGEMAARISLTESITQRTTTYILDKADALGANVQVEVKLSESQLPVPEFVKISGAVSPYVKKRLSVLLEEDLGISEENQIWT